ncbi:MAG: hypothetical protein AB1416_10680 [Actinomycetota bacterium]
MPDKPHGAADYSVDDTARSVRALLLLARVLGNELMGDVTLVGGLVPTLLVDPRADPPLTVAEKHCGTQDVDIAFSLAVLEDERYTAIAERLRRAGFAPDRSPADNPTRQRWICGQARVDFLIEPVGDRRAGIQSFDATFGAQIMRGLGLAFIDREEIRLTGTTLRDGDAAAVTIRVAGPGALVILKGLALAGRQEPKDAYDIVHTLRNWNGGTDDIAGRITRLRGSHPEVVAEALATLRERFASIDHAGPRQIARFLGTPDDDAVKQDAHGLVADLLRRVR